LVDHLILIKRDVRFPTAGNYQVKVKHGMRKNALSNVVNLGLRIEKSGA
jgi:gliding motility-associated lipoprotein GldH